MIIIIILVFIVAVTNISLAGLSFLAANSRLRRKKKKKKKTAASWVQTDGGLAAMKSDSHSHEVDEVEKVQGCLTFSLGVPAAGGRQRLGTEGGGKSGFTALGITAFDS